MPFPQPDRLFLVCFTLTHGPFENEPSHTDRHDLDLCREDRLFERVASFAGGMVTLTGAGDPVPCLQPP